MSFLTPRYFHLSYKTFKNCIDKQNLSGFLAFDQLKRRKQECDDLIIKMNETIEVIPMIIFETPSLPQLLEMIQKGLGVIGFNRVRAINFIREPNGKFKTFVESEYFLKIFRSHF